MRVICNGLSLDVTCRDEADRSVVGEIFRYREYRCVEPIIRASRQAILDIGAHAGFFTLYARCLNPIVPIVAVEPQTDNLELLHQQLKQNSVVGVKVIAGALAAVSGQRQLIISADSHNHRLAINEDERGITVKTYSFSDLYAKTKLTAVDLLKLDVEGAEGEIIASLTDDDWPKIKNLIIEYHESAGVSYQRLAKAIALHGYGLQNFPSQFDKTMGLLLATKK